MGIVQPAMPEAILTHKTANKSEMHTHFVFLFSLELLLPRVLFYA